MYDINIPQPIGCGRKKKSVDENIIMFEASCSSSEVMFDDSSSRNSARLVSLSNSSPGAFPMMQR